MAKVLKIIKPAYAADGIHTTDIWKFILHSKYPTYKIYSYGSANITAAAGSQGATKTITHNNGAPQFCMLAVEYDGKLYQLSGSGDGFPVWITHDWLGNYLGSCILWSQSNDDNVIIGISVFDDNEHFRYNTTIKTHWLIAYDEFQ